MERTWDMVVSDYVFGHKKEDITGNVRKFHVEELHDLYS
jgi:hypothetical protein